MVIPWCSLALMAFTSTLAIPLFTADAVDNHQHTTFLFNGFNGTNLIVEPQASVLRSKSVLALTNHSQSIQGRALYSIPVQMKSNGTLSSFSTTFVFSIVPSPSNAGGNGIAFFMSPHTPSMGGQPSQYLGLLNLTSNGQPYNHLFAVEFDTTNQRSDVGEMEKVLKLGLFCSHPQPECRLGIRHVCQILEGEAPLPDLCVASYNASIMDGKRELFRFTSDKSGEETSSTSRSEGRFHSASDHSTSSCTVGSTGNVETL